MKAKPWLENLKPYPPGKTLEELKREIGLEGPIYKLNSNENPLGPSPKVLEALKEALGEIHLYPEASYLSLRKAIAAKWGFSPEEVILGNGSNEIIEFLFKAYLEREDEVIVSNPSFLMYEKFAEIYGIKITKIPLTPDLKHDLHQIYASLSPKTKIIFLDHPHNPTGSFLFAEELETFLKALPSEVLLVLDEAYGDFIDKEDVAQGMRLFKKGYTLLVLKTFSKAYGLAGLRLGFALGPKKIISDLNKVRQPFNINLLAVKAGLAVLEDRDYEERSLALVREGRTFLSSTLSNLGFKVYPSQANFIMVDLGERCEIIYNYLLSKGIILRPLNNYGFPNALRITIGTEDANKTLVMEISKLLQTKPDKVLSS